MLDAKGEADVLTCGTERASAVAVSCTAQTELQTDASDELQDSLSSRAVQPTATQWAVAHAHPPARACARLLKPGQSQAGAAEAGCSVPGLMQTRRPHQSTLERAAATP